MRKKLFSAYLITFAIEGLLVTGLLLSTRQTNGELFLNTGLTLKTFFLFGLAILLFFVAVGLLILYEKRQQVINEKINSFWKQNESIINIIAFFFLWLFFESSLDIIYIFSQDGRPNIILDSNRRLLLSLLPYLIWGLLISIQSLLTIFYISIQNKIWRSIRIKDIPKEIYVFLLILILWLGLALTDYGFIPGTSNYSLLIQVGRFLPLVNPLPRMQVIILLFVVIALVYTGWKLSRDKPTLQKIIQSQALIYIVIWITAFLFWTNVPLEKNATIDISTNPAISIYPGSDALYFDREAYRFSEGEGFLDKSTHVMYSFFLSGLHYLGGDNYQEIITLQYIVLAFIPVILYMFTRDLHKPVTGYIVTVWFIFRERNGLILGGELGGSLTNQLISENLALLGMICFLYLIYLWTEQPEKRKIYPLIAGGVMGIALLIRADFAAVLIAIGVSTLLLFWKDKRNWLQGFLPLLLIVSIIITPWMYRNWRYTGIFSLDKGDFVTRRVSAYLQNIKSVWDSPEESSNDSPITLDGNTGKLNALINHFGHSIHQTFLYLPNNFQPLLGLSSLSSDDLKGRKDNESYQYISPFSEEYLNVYIDSLPYYWYTWDGNISGKSVLSIPMTILMISVGLVLLWRQNRNGLLILAGAYFSHIAIWSFAGFSGSRYLIAIDWITLLIFGIGLFELSTKVIFCLLPSYKERVITLINFSDNPSSLIVSLKNRTMRSLQIVLLIVLVLIGLGPTILENALPVKFPETAQSKLIHQIISAGDDIVPSGENCFNMTPAEEELIITYGKALYPRYYAKGEMIVDDRRETIKSPAGPRIDFYLVGTESIGVTMPEADPGSVFDHEKEVLVTGMYLSDRYIEARCVYLFEEGIDQQSIIRINCTGDKCVQE